MFNQLTTVAYVSQATKAFDPKSLLEIVDHAAQKNEELEITGALYYDDGLFAQVLEGAKAPLYQLMSTIEKDSRHQNLRCTQFRHINKRRFPVWSMHLFGQRALIDLAPELKDVIFTLEGNPEWSTKVFYKKLYLGPLSSEEYDADLFRYIYSLKT